MKGKIKLVIADDHEIFRKALISFFKDFPHIIVTGEAANGRELLDKLYLYTPDIILLDIEMPVMSGDEVLQHITRFHTFPKIIILSMYHDISFIAEYIIRGAAGFVTKGSPIEVLVKTIEKVYYHGECIEPNVSTEIVKIARRKPQRIEELTDREIEVLHLLCSGKSHKQIAACLNIVARTVDFHKANLYKKTKTNSIQGLYQYALKNQLYRF